MNFNYMSDDELNDFYERSCELMYSEEASLALEEIRRRTDFQETDWYSEEE